MKLTIVSIESLDWLQLMAKTYDIKFVSWLMLQLKPRMLMRHMASGTFVMVPFEHIIKLAKYKNISTWQYAFVNRPNQMYKMTFTSIDELVDAIFDADEIWQGTIRMNNILYNQRDEMLVKYDLSRVE